MKRISIIFILAMSFVSTPHAQTIQENTTLLGRLAPFGENGYTDIWGYESGGREYAIMGHYNGTSIIDVTDPTAPAQITFIAGPTSDWRDIKTHLHYAYITNETGSGVQIIDLENLPASAVSVGFYDATFQSAHNLYIDNGYAYIAGSNTAGGLNILDLSNPTNPVEVGRWDQTYWHDVVVNNDTLYGSAGGAHAIEIVDGTDKANLRLISRTTSNPDGYTHNIWMTDDNKYLSQTEEGHNLPVNFWDVTDPASPELIATYNAGPNSIAHNTHIRGNFAFISYYYDGLKVLDISNRRAPVEVANYDTYPDDDLQRGSGYEGAWGAYPFLPSGNILVSDRKYGLHIIAFNNTNAGYIAGKVFDANTQAPISDFKLEQVDRSEEEGITSSIVKEEGEYLLGAKPGTRTFKFSKFGYDDFFLSEVSIQPGVTLKQDIFMTPGQTGSLTINAKTVNGESIANARVIIKTAGFRTELTTDQNGAATVALPFGSYRAKLAQWGYLPHEQTVTISQAEGTQILFETQPGYVETFTDAQSWSLREPADDSAYDWFIAPAASQPYGIRLIGFDHTGDPEGFVAFTRARLGKSTFTSPAIDATILQDPVLQFARFYNPYNWANTTANDTLHVLISNDNGATWKRIDSYTSIDFEWRTLTYSISAYVVPSDQMKVRFINVEGFDSANRASAFGMIDDVKVLSQNTVGVASQSSVVIPKELKVFQNYPNPFNPATTLHWQQRSSGIAEITLFDILGRELKTFKPPGTSAGLRSFRLDLSDYSSGVYFYQIRANDAVSPVKKLVLMK